MYSNCLEWNLLKEQMVINLFAMLLLEVHLYLILFILLYHYPIDNDYMRVYVYSAWCLDIRLSTCL